MKFRTKLLFVMKLTTVILLATILQVSAKPATGQTVSYTGKNEKLEKIFTIIKQQTGYVFFYKLPDLKDAKPVTVDLKNVPLTDALKEILTDQSLSFSIEGNTVFITPKKTEAAILTQGLNPGLIPPADTLRTIKGTVYSADNKPLEGAGILVMATKKGVTTDVTGTFQLKNVDPNATIIVSFTGYTTQEISLNGRTFISIKLEQSINKLDEQVVIAYGATTKRLNTGAMGRVTNKEIEQQSLSNPLAALQGRVAGVSVTQTNGNAGSAYSIQIRGMNSLAQGNDPLFLIDGIPFPNTNIGVGTGTIGTANLGQSPMATINPADIESIEILKDADATAIYGSRGANGVVLLTTRKAKEGKTKLDVNIFSGSGKVTRMIDYMDTRQYVAMRREGFINDNIVPTVANAPDLLAWDTTRYIDWQKLLIGGIARFTNAQLSLSGGSANTQFLLGSSFHKETSVYPGNYDDRKVTFRFNTIHTSSDKKFLLNLEALYSNDKNNLPGADLTTFINLPPDAPAPYDSLGNLNWKENGATYNNPLTYILQKSNVTTDNLIGNLTLKYQILPGLNVKTSLGYTFIQFNQSNLIPIAAQNPANSPTGSARFADNTFRSWIAEPQIEYIKRIGKNRFEFLGGATFQQDDQNQTFISATNFTNDLLLGATAFAGNVTSKTTVVKYRYQAIFGRMNYNYDDTYLLNLTARRDGSSRFGPGKQYANFGALGAAWIFSNTGLIKKSLPLLSFGKVRGSFGITGNDKIGDYQYLDTYSATSLPYQGQAGLVPTSLYNPDYAWEINRKLNAGVDLGFFKDRILISIDYFRNRSSNQLVNYKLPTQTGFSSILSNFDAVVENAGWEIDLKTSNIKKKDFTWNTSVNLTIERNKLVSFSNLEGSSYATIYTIGQSLNILKLLHHTGVDAQTGTYQFTGTSMPKDQTVIKDLQPLFFGGFNNSVQYRNLSVDIFFQFVKQDGVNYLLYSPGNAPGKQSNQPVDVLSRWQHPGDNVTVQRFTTSGAASTAYQYYSMYSDARITDASFVRLKNLSVSYLLKTKWLNHIHVPYMRLYIQGQNLITITRYKGTDPEDNSSKSGINLPPLRIITAGIQLTF